MSKWSISNQPIPPSMKENSSSSLLTCLTATSPWTPTPSPSRTLLQKSSSSSPLYCSATARSKGRMPSSNLFWRALPSSLYGKVSLTNIGPKCGWDSIKKSTFPPHMVSCTFWAASALLKTSKKTNKLTMVQKNKKPEKLTKLFCGLVLLSLGAAMDETRSFAWWGPKISKKSSSISRMKTSATAFWIMSSISLVLPSQMAPDTPNSAANAHRNNAIRKIRERRVQLMDLKRRCILPATYPISRRQVLPLGVYRMATINWMTSRISWKMWASQTAMHMELKTEPVGASKTKGWR